MYPEQNPNYKNIYRYYKIIERALFYKDSTLSYSRVIEAIKKLVQTINNTKTETDVWYIGETSTITIDSIIVGSYWFLSNFHGGQFSKEYEVLSILGTIFNPGYSSLEEGSGEKEVYQRLEFLYKQ